MSMPQNPHHYQPVVLGLRSTSSEKGSLYKTVPLLKEGLSILLPAASLSLSWSYLLKQTRKPLPLLSIPPLFSFKFPCVSLHTSLHLLF